MRRRTVITELFSTFVQFSDDRFESWLHDFRLQKNMRRHEADQAFPEASDDTEREETWVIYWQQCWKADSPYALRHLYAYLQEPCFWAAERVSQRFVSVQYALSDTFQVAIARTERILANYTPSYGSCLRNYARTSFSNFIRNYLRQQKAADICSDWGLLRKLSQTQLKRALLTAGFTHPDSDILVWKCFKTVCIPTRDEITQRSVHKLKSPSEADLSQIVAQYNQQRLTLVPVPLAIDASAVTVSLKRSVQAARNLLNPRMLSLNQPLYQGSSELIDSLSAADNAAPMVQALAAEAYQQQQQQQQAIGTVLTEAIAALNEFDQTLLQLYYREQKTQKEIAERLQIKQYQVSRKLSYVRQKLLKAVANWSQETLNVSVKPDVLNDISSTIHEWLLLRYEATDEQGS